MGVKLKKDSIDLGIVAKDQDAMAAFYGDVLGFEEKELMKFPGMRIRPFQCGSTLLKIVSMKNQPAANAAPGGPAGGTGMRYFTMWVSNLDEIAARAEAAGATFGMPVTEVAPGTKMVMIEDPDGNWLEFVQVG
jgi:catechol 2,3-dioxygenase-like lactoylglutathione lyase family enzyme